MLQTFVDAGYGKIFKGLVAYQHYEWLANDENLDLWLGNSGTLKAKNRRILITHWVGEAHRQIMTDKYKHCRRRFFERTGCLITADGSDDAMIQPGGLPDYKVPPPAQYHLPNRMLQISEELTGEQNPEDLVDYTDFQHSELACPVTESLQPASRIDCFTQTDPTPPCCHHQCTDDSAAQPADPQPADPQP